MVESIDYRVLEVVLVAREAVWMALVAEPIDHRRTLFDSSLSRPFEFGEWCS